MVLALLGLAQAHALDLNASSFIPSPGDWLQGTYKKIAEWKLFSYLSAMTQLLIVIFFFKTAIEAWTTRNVGMFARSLFISVIVIALVNDAVKGGSYTNSLYKLPINAWTKVYNSASTRLSKDINDGITKNTIELGKTMQDFITNSMMGLGTMSNLASNDMYKAAIQDPTSDPKKNGSLAVKQVWDRQQKFYDEQRQKIEGMTWAFQLGYLILMGFFMAFAGVVYFSGMSIILAMFAFLPALAFWAGGNGRPIRIIFGTCLVAVATVAILPSIMLIVTDMALSQPTKLLANSIDKENKTANRAAQTYAQNMLACYAQAQKTANIPVVGGAIQPIDRTMCQISSNGPVVFAEIGRVLVRIIMGLAMMIISLMMGVGIGAALIRLVPTYLTPLFEGGPGGSDNTSLGSVGRTAMHMQSAAVGVVSTVAAPLAAGAMSLAGTADRRMQDLDAWGGRKISDAQQVSQASSGPALGGGGPATSGGSSTPVGGGTPPSSGSGGSSAVPASGGISGVPVAPGAATAPPPGANSPAAPPAGGASGGAPATSLGGGTSGSTAGGSAPAASLGSASTTTSLGGSTSTASLGGGASSASAGGSAPAASLGGASTTTSLGGGTPVTSVSGSPAPASASLSTGTGSTPAGGGTPAASLGGGTGSTPAGGGTPTASLGGGTGSTPAGSAANIPASAGAAGAAAATTGGQEGAAPRRTADINAEGQSALPQERAAARQERAEQFAAIGAARQAKADAKNPPTATDHAKRWAAQQAQRGAAALGNSAKQRLENFRRNAEAGVAARKHNEQEQAKQTADPSYQPQTLTTGEMRQQMERNGDFNRHQDDQAVRNVLAAHNTAEDRRAASDPSYAKRSLNAEQVRETLQATGNLPHQRAGNEYRAQETQQAHREAEAAKLAADPSYQPQTMSREEAHAKNLAEGNTVQQDEGYAPRTAAAQEDTQAGKAEGEAAAAAGASPAEPQGAVDGTATAGTTPARGERAYANLEGVQPGEGPVGRDGKRPPTRLTDEDRAAIHSAALANEREGRPYQSHSQIEHQMRRDGTLPSYQAANAERIEARAAQDGISREQAAERLTQEGGLTQQEHRHNVPVAFASRSQEQQADAARLLHNADQLRRAQADPAYQPRYVSRDQQARAIRAEQRQATPRSGDTGTVPTPPVTGQPETVPAPPAAQMATHSQEQTPPNPSPSISSTGQDVPGQQGQGALPSDTGAVPVPPMTEPPPAVPAQPEPAQASFRYDNPQQQQYAEHLASSYNAQEERRAAQESGYTPQRLSGEQVGQMLQEARPETIAQAQRYADLSPDAPHRGFSGPEERQYAQAVVNEHNAQEERRAAADSGYTPRPITEAQVSNAIHDQKYPDQSALPSAPAQQEPVREAAAGDTRPPVSARQVGADEQAAAPVQNQTGVSEQQQAQMERLRQQRQNRLKK